MTHPALQMFSVQLTSVAIIIDVLFYKLIYFFPHHIANPDNTAVRESPQSQTNLTLTRSQSPWFLITATCQHSSIALHPCTPPVHSLSDLKHSLFTYLTHLPFCLLTRWSSVPIPFSNRSCAPPSPRSAVPSVAPGKGIKDINTQISP